MIAQASLYNSPFGIGAASNSNNNLSTEEERERKKSEVTFISNFLGGNGGCI